MNRRTMAYGALGTGALAAIFGAGALVWAGGQEGGFLARHAFAHGHGEHRGFLSDPERAKEHLSAAVSWTLEGVDATDEQQQKVKAALSGAVDDLAGLAKQHRECHQAIVAALSGPQVDRAALERLRKSQMETLDQASSRIVTAIADAADVLTPEQRAKLAGLAERMHH